jgi:hypothetical protein
MWPNTFNLNKIHLTVRNGRKVVTASSHKMWHKVEWHVLQIVRAYPSRLIQFRSISSKYEFYTFGRSPWTAYRYIARLSQTQNKTDVCKNGTCNHALSQNPTNYYSSSSLRLRASSRISTVTGKLRANNLDLLMII